MSEKPLKIVKHNPNDYSLSRYKRVYELIDGSAQYHDLPVARTIPKSNLDRHHLVTVAEANRLDVLAYTYYKNVAYWWVIAEANDIVNPTIVEPGTVLRIPPLEVLFGEGGILV